MPEIAIATQTEDLPTAGEEKIRLKDLNKTQQVAIPFGYAVESIDSALVQHVIDNTKISELDSGSLAGIAAEDQEVGKDLPFEFIFNDYRLNINNNIGALSADYRTRLLFAVKELTTIRKLANGRTLSSKDNDAIKILKGTKDSPGILDVISNFNIGMRIPKNFRDGLLDEVIGAEQRALGAGVNLVTGTRQELANIDVDSGTMLVLTNIGITVPVKADARDIEVFISRDDDSDLISFDPAALETSKKPFNLYTPAYDELKVEILQSAGVHNNFKAYAGFVKKRVGLFHKAKLLEFSADFIPDQINISEADLAAIDELHLRQLARVGAISN